MHTGSATAAAPRRPLASIGAVIAGFATTALLSVGIDAILHGSNVYPPYGVRMSDGLFGLATGYRALAAIAGGWVTVRLAPSRPWLHAVILAVLGTLGGLAGVVVAVTHPEMGPLWYSIAVAASAVPCIAVGAWLGARRSSAPP